MTTTATHVATTLTTTTTDRRSRDHHELTGDMVWTLLSDRSRWGALVPDPEVFDDPEELALDREPGSHVAFGFGPHLCLGTSLARMEQQTVLRALVTRLSSLDFGGEPQWRTTSPVRGLAHFPVTW